MVIAGLGLFFFGIKLLSSSLKQISGDWLRDLLEQGSRTFVGAAFWGSVAGFVTQSARALYFIIASFVSAEMLSIERALPLLFWGNAGRALFSVAVVLPLKMVALFGIGLFGICHAFECPRRHRHLVGALFGISLFLFGLEMMKGAAGALLQLSWFQGFLASLKGQNMVSFFIGMGATFFCQSHVGITCIAIALCQTGVFDAQQTFMLLYGTHAGSSLISYSLSFHFQGSSRQIVMSQVLYNVLGSVFFVGLFYLETWFQIPLVQSLARNLSENIGHQAAYVAVLFTVPPALFLTVSMKPFLRLLNRLCPPLPQETLAKTRFISSPALETPETALMLAEKEQRRLFQQMTLALEAVRGNGETKSGVTIENWHEASIQISAKIQAFLGEILKLQMNGDSSQRLVRLQSRQNLFTAIAKDIHEFCLLAQGAVVGGKARGYTRQILEALDMALRTTVSFAENGDAGERRLLTIMTSGKGKIMGALRRDCLNNEPGICVDERLKIIEISNLFEHAMWAIGKFASYLETSGTGENIELKGMAV